MVAAREEYKYAPRRARLFAAAGRRVEDGADSSQLVGVAEVGEGELVAIFVVGVVMLVDPLGALGGGGFGGVGRVGLHRRSHDVGHAWRLIVLVRRRGGRVDLQVLVTLFAARAARKDALHEVGVGGDDYPPGAGHVDLVSARRADAAAEVVTHPGPRVDRRLGVLAPRLHSECRAAEGHDRHDAGLRAGEHLVRRR